MEPHNQPLPALPVEIWVTIFKQLEAHHLMRVRLVCRQWNQIIFGCAALIDQLEVTFVGVSNAYEYRCDQIKALAKSPTRFSKAKLQGVDLNDPKELLDEFLKYWSVFARSLRHLNLHGCEIPFKGMIAMLRATRNLKQLEYDVGPYQYFKPCKVDFVLNKLEVLSIGNLECSHTLDTFRAICPNLRDLKLESGISDSEYGKTVIQFVQGTQATLKNIRLKYSTTLLSEMIQMKRLILDHVTLKSGYSGDNTESLVEFSRSFPSISYLDISEIENCSGTTLNQIAENLPQLRCFKVRPPKEPMDFLRAMPSLERLAVQSVANANLCFNLGDFKSSVQHLTCRFPNAVLLRNFPNIHSLSLKNCTLERSSDVILMITQSPQLKHLRLCSLEYDRHDVSTAPSAFQGVRANVRTFRATFMNPPRRLNELLTAVIWVSPLLEKIDWHINSLDVLDLWPVSQYSKNLQVLTVYGLRLFILDLNCLVAALRKMNLRRLDIGRLAEDTPRFKKAAAEVLAGLESVDVTFH